MIRNRIAFRDYETGSKNARTTQPLQLACVMIDIRQLQVIPESVFESKIKPMDDETAVKKGWAPIEDEALKINKLTREELALAPEPKIVWENYISYLGRWNLDGRGGSKWSAPAAGGFNSKKFDDKVDEHMCEVYGPKLDDYGGWTMYHPIYNFDVFQEVQNWFHSINISPNGSIGMDAVRNFMGYDTEGAHNALVDVLQGADLLCRFLKLQKHFLSKVKFKGCAKEWTSSLLIPAGASSESEET